MVRHCEETEEYIREPLVRLKARLVQRNFFNKMASLFLEECGKRKVCEKEGD